MWGNIRELYEGQQWVDDCYSSLDYVEWELTLLVLYFLQYWTHGGIVKYYGIIYKWFIVPLIYTNSRLIH